MARLFLRGRIFYAGYYVNGVEQTPSLRTDNRRIAERRLAAIIKKTALGWEPQDDRLTFDGLIEKVRLDRAEKGMGCKDLDQRTVHLRMFFGDMRAVDITTDHGKQYRLFRKRAGAKTATINNELAVLRRAFTLSELLHPPKFEMPNPQNARKDFLDWPDFQAVLAEMPEEMRDVVTFIYLSTWRQSQVCALEWRDIDMKAWVATARGETTKNGQPHQIPLANPEGQGLLLEIIRRAKDLRRLDCPFVFHLDGKPFLLRGSKSPLRIAWAKATVAAGFGGHVLHCLRRSGVRNMVRAGVPPSIAREQSGHKSMAMFERYNIVTLEDRQRGLAKMMDYLAEQPSEGKVRAIGGKP